MTRIYILICFLMGIECLAQEYPVRYTLTSDKDYIDSWPSFSPDENKIVFARSNPDNDNSWKLYTMDMNTKTLECIISDTVSLITTRPNWSFDDRIAFTGVDPSKPNQSAIYSIDYKSKELVTITDPSGLLDAYPQWSKDNAWISFIRLDTLSPDFNLWKITPGQKEIQLTNSEYYDGKNTISPDGKQIAFSSDRGGNFHIWIISSEKAVANANQFTSIVGRAPSWSPDGNWIAFVSIVPDITGRNKRAYAIFVKNVLSNEIIQLTDGSLNEMHPEWSRDGTKIIFDARDLSDEGYIQYIEVDNLHNR